MSATLLQLRDQIVVDAGIEGNTQFPVVRLNRMINQAQKFVQLKLTGLGMKKWEKRSSVITPTTSSFAGVTVKKIDLATNLTDILESANSIPFIEVDDDDVNYALAYPIDKDKFISQIKNTYSKAVLTADEAVFSRISNAIYIYPSEVVNAYVHYYQVVTDLSSDASETGIPIEYEDFIIKKVVLEIDDVLGKIGEKQEAVRQMENDIRGVFQSFQLSEVQDNAIERKQKVQLQ